MNPTRDFWVGVFILLSAGVLLGSFVVTSNLFDGRVTVYMRAETANGLTQNTRVVFQGLQIGQVMEIQPAATDTGIAFVARLRIQENFPDGTSLGLRVGTTAVIEQPTPITPPAVRLVNGPTTPGSILLAAGDTIASLGSPNTLDALIAVIFELRDQAVETFEHTRRLMDQTGDLLGEANATVRTATPRIQDALALLNASLLSTDSLLGDIRPRIGPMHDSISVALGTAHELLMHVDTLAHTAGDLIAENRPPINEILQRLANTARTLEHFADQVRRRPIRLLTGVSEPPPSDTSESS